MINLFTKESLRMGQILAVAGLALLITANNSSAQAVAKAATKEPALAMEAKEASLAEAKASLLARLKELDEQFELKLEAPEPIASPTAQPAAAPAQPVDLSSALMQSIEGTMTPGATLKDRENATLDTKAMAKNIETGSFLVKKIEALERMLKLLEMKEEILSERKDFDKRMKNVQAKIDKNEKKSQEQ